MAQSNESNYSFDSPVKRKRGRPRKENVKGTQTNSRIQRRIDSSLPASATIDSIVNDDLVGKQFSGTLDGAVDSGFLLTTRVNGTILRGIVFDSRVAVPVTASNDVAPNVKMFKREEFSCPAPISAEPLQTREPLSIKAQNDDSVQGCHVLNSKAEDVPKVQVSDGQSRLFTGEQNLDSASREVAASLNFPTVDNQKHELAGNGAVIGELKLDSHEIKEASEIPSETLASTLLSELDSKEVLQIDSISDKNVSTAVPQPAALNPKTNSDMLIESNNNGGIKMESSGAA